MEFKILGPVAVEDDGRAIALGGARQRALLAILLLHRGEVVATERLIEELYGSSPPAGANTSIRASVSRLRTALGRSELIRAHAGGYILEPEQNSVDADRFARLVEEGRRLRAAGENDEAVARLREAVQLWRGPALADFAYDDFAQAEIARLEELRIAAIEERIGAELDLGRHAEVVAELEHLVREFPVRERLRAQLMLALYRSGRQAEALESFQEIRRTLVDELGVDPGAELRELQSAILRQDAALAPRAPRRGALPSSREGDANLVLLEREKELAALGDARDAAARGEGGVVLVTGEPGIGKTSLVTRFLRDHSDHGSVLVGTCDDLSIPRPLGAIYDLVGSVSPGLHDALSGGAAVHDIHALLLAELELPPVPTVLVVEDVHWADEATCDAITVVGRRIGALPALLVLTYRGGEARPGHPLYAAIGEIRANTSAILELAPLSESAVASLVGGADAEGVYAATGGNPFYVTELLASDAGASLPPSVASSVIARAARLTDDSRRLLELVSTVPTRVATSVLDAVMPDWAAAAEEPERRQLLEVEPRWVRFRHELARNAIASNVPNAAQRRHHVEILEALLDASADPAEIVHHAEAAGADAVAAEYALVAARRAAALESNLEAYSYYLRTSSFVDRLPASEQAGLLEELATAAYAVGRLEEASAAIERAIDVYERLEEAEALGRCKRMLSRYRWYAGDGSAARENALDAVATLEPLGESVELGRAYSVASQLAMLADDAAPALELGRRALDLALRLGDDGTRAHALVNLGSVEMQFDPDAIAVLLEAHAVADAARDRHEATRALNNLATRSMSWARPDAAFRHAELAVAYAEEHQVHTIGSYARTLLAWLRLRAGEWDEAERIARSESERGAVLGFLTTTVLAELAVRRGDADASERLADLTAQADRAEELQRLVPALELAIERTLTSGAPLPTERLAKLADAVAPRGALAGRFAMRVAAWAAVAGLEVTYVAPKSAPYSAMQRCDWRAAADAFGDIRWTYDRALMLSLTDDETSLAEAFDTARGLGAGPLANRVATRLLELGHRVPEPSSVS